MKKYITLVSCCLILYHCFACAESIPTVNLFSNTVQDQLNSDNDQQQNTLTEESLSLETNVTQLKQQITNLQSLRLPEKIEELQQQLQKVSGRLDVIEHQFKKITPSNTTVKKNAQIKQILQKTSNLFHKKSEETLYQMGLKHLRNKQYFSASHNFKQLIKNYSSGKRASDAMYWLGEINYTEKNYNVAQACFQQLINRFPSSKRIPSALLKLGLSLQASNKKTEAEVTFSTLQKQYPDSTAALLARQTN